MNNYIISYFIRNDSKYQNLILNSNPSRYLPIKKKSGFFNLISKKPLTPSKKEISTNIRSRSAKLRYAIRNDNDFFYPTEFKKRFDSYFKIEEGIRL